MKDPSLRVGGVRPSRIGVGSGRTHEFRILASGPAYTLPADVARLRGMACIPLLSVFKQQDLWMSSGYFDVKTSRGSGVREPRSEVVRFDCVALWLARDTCVLPQIRSLPDAWYDIGDLP